MESLLIDVVLDIVERLDVASVVRCAATSKAFRGTILGLAFRRSGGFDSTLLLGFSFFQKSTYRSARMHRAVLTTPSNASCARLGLLGSFQPAASRDGFFVLRRNAARRVKALHLQAAVELCVRDTLTGRDELLPPVAFQLLLELLVMDTDLRFSTFSSGDGRWGDPRQATQHPQHLLQPHRPLDARPPVVIGHTVYYSCWVYNNPFWDRILALDTTTALATLVEVPQRCFSGMMTIKNNEYLLLASVQGRLRLLVADSLRISMWTAPPLESLDSGAAWTRQTVISKWEIQRQTLLDRDVYGPVCLRGFGERSGAIILQLGEIIKGTILRIDLGTKEPRAVIIEKQASTMLDHFYLHEIDMASLLKAMKSF
ncbi:hypothetical protein BRADI_4g29616v3 [Brachypodium distachyon]|uniref:DUF7595 domain-containing protein n=1 Tax=Brachypodium distachyon TaxID=15368 RepID=A0A0Q3ERN8_BRADI|nr:hypothetical protein BRADI_4g29616v3 [Brachypodium distachyon]